MVPATAFAVLGCLFGAGAFHVSAPGQAFTCSSLSRWVMRPAGRRVAALSMASTSDFKTGLTIEVDGAPVRIQEFLHVKPGKGAAFVRSKLKNLLTGNTLEKTFRAGESVALANVERLEMQYTYAEGDNFFFMDTTSYEEVPVPTLTVGDSAQWLLEGMTLEALKWNGKVIDLMVPKTMTLTVVETDPGVKGNTAQGGSKPAKLESGAIVNVPLFIVEGEKIRIDTQEKKYLGRDGSDS